MRDPPGGDHMIDPVSGAASAPAASRLFLVPATSTTDASPPSATPNASEAPSPPAGPAPAATRVYVDRSASGVYVYQLVDATTGQVIVELPRAESGSLKVFDGYEPGAAARVSV